jgi:DNA-binding transcriptional MerR regulator
MKMPDAFETSDVVNLVGISPIYLNRFIERGLYGIAPSQRREVGRGGRRWFNSEDVFGIGLVWWLFESGLRSEVIKRILREFAGQNQDNANRAAKALRENGSDFLVIRRLPRGGREKQARRTRQAVDMLDKHELLDLLEKGEAQVTHAIPVGRLFRNLELMIQES